VVVHVRTVKGKGFPPAELEPHRFHGVSPFDLRTGESLSPSKPDFSAAFGSALVELAREDKRLCAVTAAMLPGTGLSDFAQRFPERTFDVGIAEGHAVTMCGGMAKQGAVPVFAVYSTFLQRSYDMLLHDVALENLHVVFGVDRAGLVGADGETHQGVFDLAMLATVPGMTVLAPASFAELRTMLRWAVEECGGPVALRYPRGGEEGFDGDCGLEPVSLLREGTDVTLITHGILTGTVLQAAQILEEQGISAQVVKLNRVCPLEKVPLRQWAKQTGRVLVAEEVADQGCAGEVISADFAQNGVELEAFQLMNCGSQFIPHGSVAQLREMLGLTAKQLAEKAENMVKTRK
jgi:1-deoxy-D-xylulose-5-phosphate synthase